MIKKLVNAILFLVIGLASNTAYSHTTSTSYLTIDLNKNTLSGIWKITLKDIHLVLDLDTDDDSRIIWSEIITQKQKIISELNKSIRLSNNNNICNLNIKKLMIDRSGSNVYLNVPFTSNCNSNTGFKLKYNFLFDQDAFHKTILSIKDNNNNTTNILSYSTREITYNNQNNNSIYHFFEFIYQGIIHVLIGLDHVLFVICLLLSATVRVTIKNDKKLKPLLNNIFKLVTAFTIAHSITLIMASTKILSISPTIIEPIIALSVIVLALLNLINTKNVKHWPIVFAFGLIHGFGFAFVLDEVPIQSGELISSLFGFNLGVEIGQLTIVAILIPVLYFMYSKLYYQRLIIPALSIVIASIGIFWFLERTLII